MDTPESIHMLVIGLPLRTYQEKQHDMKQRVRRLNSHLLFVSFSAETFGKAVELAKISPHIDIVYLCNMVEPSFSKVLAGCEVLSRAMAERLDKPWAWVSPALNYIYPTLRSNEIRTHFGELEHVVQARRDYRQLLPHYLG